MIVNDTNLVFYIAHYYSNIQSLQLLKLSIQSIQRFYPHSDIVVCESPSLLKETAYDDISGVNVIINPIPNSSVIGCFKEYMKRYETSNKKGIFIHDSMVLTGRFDDEKLSRQFGFIWSFSQYHEPRDTCNEELGKFLHNYLNINDMNCDDYVGDFGPSVYGSYESIVALWNETPFELFMTYEDRKGVILDLERIIGAVAFKLKLVTSTENCALCGDIFDDGARFGRGYEGETLEEIIADPYKESAIKFWCGRLNLL